MLSKGFIDTQGGGWLLMIFDLAERTILYREIGLCPGDD